MFAPRKALWCAHRRIPLPRWDSGAWVGLVTFMGYSFTSEAIRRGCGGRAESPLHCITKRQHCCKKIPLMGLDAPTPAREKGLQPYGALTLFFRWRKKSVQKKASGTATPGKSPLLPILTAGLAMSRAAELARLRMPSCALGARLFPPSKWAGLFPSTAYRRSAPPQSACGILTPCGLDVSVQLKNDAA